MKKLEELPFISIIIHWKGPYKWDQLSTIEEGNGLYMITGKRKYERNEQIQYFGITERGFKARLRDKGHKINSVKPDTLGVWIGEVCYPSTFERAALEITEHCLVHFWSPNLNAAKVKATPSMPAAIISHWSTPEGKPRLKRPSIIKSLPDVLVWDMRRWRSGKLRLWAEYD